MRTGANRELCNADRQAGHGATAIAAIRSECEGEAPEQQRRPPDQHLHEQSLDYGGLLGDGGRRADGHDEDKQDRDARNRGREFVLRPLWRAATA